MQSNRVTLFAYSLMCLGSDARLAVADPIAPRVFVSFVTFPFARITAAKVVPIARFLAALACSRWCIVGTHCIDKAAFLNILALAVVLCTSLFHAEATVIHSLFLIHISFYLCAVRNDASCILAVRDRRKRVCCAIFLKHLHLERLVRESSANLFAHFCQREHVRACSRAQRAVGGKRAEQRTISSLANPGISQRKYNWLEQSSSLRPPS